MKIKLDPWATMPTRAHSADAGFDLYAPEDAVVPARSSVVIDTGVHMALPPCTAGLLVSKSGLNVKSDITSTGLIDSGYTGSIFVKLYNYGWNDYVVRAGDKISQIVVIPVILPPLQQVDELDESARGDAGFGSSGR